MILKKATWKRKNMAKCLLFRFISTKSFYEVQSILFFILKQDQKEKKLKTKPEFEILHNHYTFHLKN